MSAKAGIQQWSFPVHELGWIPVCAGDCARRIARARRIALDSRVRGRLAKLKGGRILYGLYSFTFHLG